HAAVAPVDQDAVDANFVPAIALRLGLTDVLADDVEQGHMPLRQRKAILSQLYAPELCIIDARTAERYRGEVEPLDPVAGHIPGAFNRPSSENLHSDGSFKSAEQLRAEWTSFIRGVSPDQVVHQCGSGITACHNLFAMELAGLSGSALYPGSWSEWVAHSGAPIDVG